MLLNSELASKLYCTLPAGEETSMILAALHNADVVEKLLEEVEPEDLRRVANLIDEIDTSALRKAAETLESEMLTAVADVIEILNDMNLQDVAELLENANADTN